MSPDDRAVAFGEMQRSRLDATLLSMVALGVNLMDIGRKSFSLDEAASALYVRRPFSELIAVLTAVDPNMSAYQITLYWWRGLFGETEAGLRSLSALCGALAVGVVCLIGARLFGRMGGIVAGLALMLNAFMISYAQTARGYAMLVLFVSLASLCFVRELEQPSRWNRVAYVAASVVAVHTHYFAIFVLLSHAAVLAMHSRSLRARGRWWPMAAAIVALCLPETVLAWRSGAVRGVDWVGAAHARDIARVLIELASGSRLTLALLIVAGGVLVASVRRRGVTRGLALTLTWLALPIVLVFALSFAMPSFIAQYLLITVPALALIAGAAVAELRRTQWQLVATLALVVASLPPLRYLYERDAYQDWRAASQFVGASQQVGDGLLFVPMYSDIPFNYYARYGGATVQPRTSRANLDSARQSWLIIRESDAAANPRELRAARDSLAARLREVERKSFGQVTVVRYVR